uniref:Nuclear pore complex protein n=1 Tax=Steinernema glaseri TaxID=37863 RepID=A0A1I7Y980_9BILA
MDFDLPSNASQSKEIDVSQIFSELSKAIFEDFHRYVSGEQGPIDLYTLLESFESTSRYGTDSMRRLLEQNGASGSELHDSLEQLEKERDTYRLIARLIKAEVEVKMAKDSDTKSVLGQLLNKDSEFRRLRVLLQWIEEVAFEDPQFLQEVMDDYRSFDDVSYIFSNTQAVPSGCQLDFDGRFASGAKIHSADEERVERAARVILHLMKCGRYKEVKDLMDKFGFPSLIPFIIYKDFLNDPALSTLDTEHENHELYKARMQFKDTARQIILQEDSPLHPIERSMLAVLAGEVEPLLSHSTTNTHKLFTFLNASIEARLDAELASMGDEDMAEEDQAYILSTDDVFDKITLTEKLPYYQLYRFIATDEFGRALSFMLDWAKTMRNKGELKTHAQILRFFVHLTLFFKTTGSSLHEIEFHQLLRYYIEVLKDMELLTLIPFYMSHLPKDEGLRGVVDLLYDLEESKDVRTLVIVKIEQAGFNPTEVCELVYDKVLAENAKPDADDSTALKIFNIFPYLLYLGHETAVRAIVEANNLLRLFFEIERLDLGTDLIDVINQTIKKDLEDVVSEIWTGKNEEISPQCVDYINEFSHYKSYYNALDLYDTWKIQWNTEAPVLPEPMLRSKYEQLTVAQKNHYASERRIAKEKIERYHKHRENCKNEAVEALKILLDVETQFFVASYCGRTEKDNERKAKLSELRPPYVVKVYMMLIDLYSRAGEQDALIELAESLVDSTTQYYNILSKDQLRGLNQLLTAELECFVATNMLS